MAKRESILVVNHDPDIATLTVCMLQQSGYDVSSAGSGASALEKVREFHPDLVLLDHTLNDISGSEVCRRIKANPNDAETLVVVVTTARTPTSDEAVALESGADGCIARNIPTREFLARIEALLRVQRRERALRLSETALMQQRAELQMILDSVPALIFYKDRDHRFLRVNAALARLAGRPATDFIGKTDAEMGSPHAGKYIADEEEIARTRMPKHDILEPMSSAEGLRWLNTVKVPLLNAAGEVNGFVGFAQDITARKLAEAAFEQEHTLLRTVIDALPDLTFTKDLDGRYDVSNLAHSAFIGAKSGQSVIGKTVFELFPRALAEAYHADDLRVLHAGETIFNREELACDAEGNFVWHLTIKTPLRDPSGKIIGLVGMCRNIQARKESEQALQKLSAELEQRVIERTAELSAANNALLREIAERTLAEANLIRAKQAADDANRSKSTFLANVSHEIRTPMNGIIGMNHLLKQTSLTARQSDYASSIDSTAQSLLGIINDILDFSKIEAGIVELERVDFDLDQLFTRIVESTAALAKQKELIVKVTVTPGMPRMLVGDPLRLEQVLLNLVTNAIKFTEVGEIEISVESLDQSNNTVAATFRVRDTGIGISADCIAKLFDPFGQADSSTTRRYGGKGLGLAITKRFVQLMGGRLSVQSTPGHGAAFVFTAQFGCRPDTRSNKTFRRSVMAGRRVLLIDGDAFTCAETAKLLAGLSFSVTAVDSCISAACKILSEKANAQRFDLVLMDCSASGSPWCDEVKNLAAECGSITLPPCVLIASTAMGDEHLKLKEAGFARALIRPITNASLFDAVVSTLLMKPESQDVGRSARLGLKGRKILVVEDNEINQQIVMELLTIVGCQVTVAADGKQALAILNVPRISDFEAILMDIQMPGLDGYETTQFIRLDDRYERLPIIALTADVVAGVREQCLAAGMNAYLTKPVDPEELYFTLDKWIKAMLSPDPTEQTDRPREANEIAALREQRREVQEG